MEVMKALRSSSSSFYSLDAEGRNLVDMQERVIAHLHKWIYVENIFSQKGGTQVSVIFIRSHDFLAAFL